MLGISALALALLLSWNAAGAAAERHRSRALDVTVSEGLLTVDLDAAPLGPVLRAVGEQAGIDVTILGDFDAPVTQSFAAVPLEEGIRRLTRGRSLAVTYVAAADDPTSRVLAAIWVMGAGSTTRDSAPWPARAQAPTESPSGETLGEIPALVGQADRDGAAVLAKLGELSLSGRDGAVREQAVAALERLGGAAVEPVLVAALADDDAAVRVRAVRGLRGLGTDTALQSLAGVVTGDAEPRVRLAALRALASFPGRWAFDGLARATSDPDDFVRESAVRGLSWWTTRTPGAR